MHVKCIILCLNMFACLFVGNIQKVANYHCTIATEVHSSEKISCQSKKSFFFFKILNLTLFFASLSTNDNNSSKVSCLFFCLIFIFCMYGLGQLWTFSVEPTKEVICQTLRTDWSYLQACQQTMIMVFNFYVGFFAYKLVCMTLDRSEHFL